MKLASLVPTIFALALPAFAQVTEPVTYSTEYDDTSLPLSDFFCYDSIGIGPVDYPTLGSLPTFPFVGGSSTVSWNKTDCSTCYNLTFDNTTITILIVNNASEPGFVISEEAMDALTDGLGVVLGTVEATAVEVPASVCGIEDY